MYLVYKLIGSYLSVLFYALIAPKFWLYRKLGRQDDIDRITARLIQKWSHRYFEKIDCQVLIEGGHLVPMDGPLVVMTNHQSIFDIPLLMGYLGRPAGFIAKRELFRVPGLAYWMKQIKSVSLDRQDPRAGLALYDELAKRMVAENYCYVIFPEGTRTRDPEGRIAPFRRGALRLAGNQHVPILPIAIDGTRFVDNRAALARSKNGGRMIRVKILPPVTAPTESSKERKIFMDNLRESIVAAWEEVRVSWPQPADPENSEKTAMDIGMDAAAPANDGS